MLARKWDDPDFQQYREAFPEEHRSTPAALQAHVENLTKRDVKIAYLKNLQGYLWADGYRTGAYSTPLFADVAPCLSRWKEDGLKLAIYSSGSVFAQKLLFAHVSTDGGAASKQRGVDEVEVENDGTAPEKKRGRVTRSQTTTAASNSDDQKDAKHSGGEGGIEPASIEDLTELFEGWFDTTNAGLKTEAGSYRTISREMNVSLNLVTSIQEQSLISSSGKRTKCFS